MSMSTHVVGYRPRNEEWDRQAAVWAACKAAGVEVPPATAAFFDHTDPTGLPGMEVGIKGAVTPFSTDYQHGFDVDLTKLPKGVTVLRFYNAW